MIINDKWFDLVCASYENPPVFFEGKKLPAFPTDQLQISTTGQAGRNTLAEAFVFYQDCLIAFQKYGLPLQKEGELLDFGVGWGRIARFFLRELSATQIHGVDVMEDFIKICHDTFETDNFTVTPPFPPVNLPSGKFSHIVGYSVFSHLSEEACMSWMKEFYRLLARGGIVALTTRGRPFFDYCESLKSTGYSGSLDSYRKSLANMFEDFPDARNQYDQGRFVHSNLGGVSGNGAMNSSFYGETFIPQIYAEASYSEWFDFLEFQFDPSRQTHPIMIFRRK